MLIFIQERLAFLATPKTGSTAIEMALGPRADIRISRNPRAKHTPLRKYRRFIEPFVKTLSDRAPDTMALVREPVDWLGSWWRYRSRDEIEGTPTSTKGLSFDAFVEAYLSDDPPEFARVGSQAQFLSDRDGEIGVSYLFRYEDMGAAVAFLERRLNGPVRLERQNVSPRGEVALAPSLRRELESRHRADFELHARLSPD